MGKKDWSKYPGRLVKSYAGLPGVGLTISGFLLGAAALIPGVNIAGSIILGIGAGIGGVSILGGAISAIPQEFREAVQLVGKYETLDSLADIDPPLYKIGIVGISRSGKSTLTKSFCRIPEEKREEGKTEGKTTELYVYIYGLFLSPKEGDTVNNTKFLGFIDGDGAAYYQQLKIAQESDFLCVVMDHNSIGKESHKNRNIAQIDKDRLTKHEEFIDQIYQHLKNQRKENPLSRIHFLLNKKDFWNKNGSQSSNELESWFETHINKWRDTALFTKSISFDYHSNQEVEYMQKFESEILNALTAEDA
ncbi:GTPase domain-containing protein [Okeania sp. SIO2B3]|uniref:GTPase domain-containing protein n=1 Tax=Okeania sp. SIO2B3 TaxID=2607784 RepID=UPI0013C1B15C|nr:GTPase domain-containing protein [Okeania sp. SIO2B3]NET46446.1 GTPase domain-containing protein [Okeania sp. SIO2B3]